MYIVGNKAYLFAVNTTGLKYKYIFMEKCIIDVIKSVIDAADEVQSAPFWFPYRCTLFSDLVLLCE